MYDDDAGVDGEGEFESPPDQPVVDKFDALPPAERQLSPWLWLVDLYFRPTLFFKHYARESTGTLVILCAWILGATSYFSHLDGDEKLLNANWAYYWGYLLVAGAIVGLILHFFLGTWWYRFRLHMAGVQGNPDPGVVRRLYLYSATVTALPSMLIMVRDAMAHASPMESFNSPIGWWHFADFAFCFWSVFCSYRGVRALFKTRTLPTVIWFLALPLFVYSLVLVVLVGALVLLQTEEPDLENIQIFSGDGIEFAFPGNWESKENESDPGYDFVELEGSGAYVSVTTYWSEESEEAEVDVTIEGYAESDNWTFLDTFNSLGPLQGAGQMGTYTEDGYVFEVRIFVVKHGEDQMLEFHAVFDTADVDLILPVVEHVAETLEHR